jgi:hypothetical protein
VHLSENEASLIIPLEDEQKPVAAAKTARAASPRHAV